MKLISHRGKIGYNASEVKDEKDLQFWLKVYDFDIELDFWHSFGKLRIGHELSETVEADIIKLQEIFSKYADRIWCHAKNATAVKVLIDLGAKHVFMHDQDDASLTSSGYLWGFTKTNQTANSICVVRSIDELEDILMSSIQIYGICSDFVGTTVFWKLFGGENVKVA